MHVNALNYFKKISLQKKIIIHLNCALDFLKEEHACLVNEKLCIFSTLEENVDIVECDTFPILKLKRTINTSY